MMFALLLTGVEGAPIPYSPRTDDIVSLTLLACFFLTAIALSRGKKFLVRQLKDFFLHRERTNLFDTSTGTDMRSMFTLVVQTCVLSGITLFNYFHDVQPTLMQHAAPSLLLAVYVGACLAYVFLKWLSYLFIGWIFFDKSQNTMWLESYFTLIYYVGFLLFPYVLLIVYFDLSLQILSAIGLVLLIFTKILMFYKWIKLFYAGVCSLFLLIFYFCALEIVPCLLLFQGLIQFNNILLIKF